ncbi:MAG: transposase [Candidatus Bipolaricaulota bacterium]|nr:MAG: transposase [Candidatus Bipolaricaulota bacterium]
MARIARVVIPGCPHHVTQRGVRRMEVFFGRRDRPDYLKLLRRFSRMHGITYLAWCLMPNHIHLLAIPEDESSLARGLGEAHKQYTKRINKRHGCSGYLFQGRFYSCPVAPEALIAVTRYILRNPVRAHLVCHAWEYPWSSAAWLIGAIDHDPLVEERGPLLEVDDWTGLLEEDDPMESRKEIRTRTRAGRPLGPEAFVRRLERQTGRVLRPRKRGPKARAHALDEGKPTRN